MNLSKSRKPLASIATAALLWSLNACAWADLRISGSETLEPYFQDALNQFARGEGAGIPVKASYKGSLAGLKDLCRGQAAIVPSSSQMDAETMRLCRDAGIAYVELPIAFDAVVVIANPRLAALGELGMNDLKTIFSADNAGKIIRWQQLRPGLPDTPLSVVSLDPRSGTTGFFSSKVTGMSGFVRPDAKVTSDHSALIAMVAADPGAIGFVSMGALAESKAAVWRVPVNFGRGPVVASRDAVLNGSYAPLSRLLYIYASKAGLVDKDGQSRKFLKWVMERGAKLALYENFVPLIDQNYRDNASLLLAN
jgi:phosphate transport system substrate-binding protein